MGVHACMTPRGKERTNERTKWRQPQQQRTARTIIIITIITTMMNRYRKPAGTMQRRQSKARLTTLVTLTSAMMDTSVRIVDVALVNGLKKKDGSRGCAGNGCRQERIFLLVVVVVGLVFFYGARPVKPYFSVFFFFLIDNERGLATLAMTD